MQYIPLIHEYIKIAIVLYGAVLLWLKWADLKQIVSEDTGKMSAKRVIAFMGMSTLCRLALYVTHTNDKGMVDNNILAVLTGIVITACSIASFPQIAALIKTLTDFLNKAKTIDNKEKPTETV